MTPTITETTYQTEIGPITAREHCENLGVMHPNEHHLALAENELRAMEIAFLKGKSGSLTHR